MPAEDRIPVVVASGQATERDGTVWASELAARASEVALEQAPALRARIARVSMVNILSGGGAAPAASLARRLGLSATTTEVSTIGGNSPQWLVNRAAAAIAAGDLEAVLVAGAESQHSKLRSRSAATRPATAGAAERLTEDAEAEELRPDPLIGDTRPGAGPVELSAGLVAPVHVYALFESVIAQRSGRSFAEQRSALGELMAPFTEVASKNPYAWFRDARTPAELSQISVDNRLVAEPYPKRMCAVMGVDQGAAVVVTSLAAARAAGVADRAIFCWSGADASDVWFPSARPDPGSSPGIRAATQAALEASCIGIDDVSAIDLYSCFPCVVEMAVEALGIDSRDERGLTVTGGLAYFGGPGNNYTLHAIATMIERLRDQGGVGLVSGLGWYATKHSVGIYSDTASGQGWRRGDSANAQREIDESAVEVADPAAMSGRPRSLATVIAATLAVGHDGELTSAPIIARLDDGRQVALAAHEAELLSLAGRNLVGERVAISGTPPRYRVAG
jgi:acetyl-CoA C-acetyltransferase